MVNKLKYLNLIEFLLTKTSDEHGLEHPQLKFNCSDVINDDIPTVEKLDIVLKELQNLIKVGDPYAGVKIFKRFVINPSRTIITIYDVTTNRLKAAYKKINENSAFILEPIRLDLIKISDIKTGESKFFKKDKGFILNNFFQNKRRKFIDYTEIQRSYNKYTTGKVLTSDRFAKIVKQINDDTTKMKLPADLIEKEEKNSAVTASANRYKWNESFS